MSYLKSQISIEHMYNWRIVQIRKRDIRISENIVKIRIQEGIQRQRE